MNRCKTCKHHYRVVGDGVTTVKKVVGDSCNMMVDNHDDQEGDKVYYSEWIDVPDNFGCIHHECFSRDDIDANATTGVGDLVVNRGWLDKSNKFSPFVVTREWVSKNMANNSLDDFVVLIKARGLNI